MRFIEKSKNLADPRVFGLMNNVTSNADGSVLKLPLVTSGNGIFYGNQQLFKTLCPTLKAGDTVTLSFKTNYDNSMKIIFLNGSRRSWRIGTYLTITQEDLDSYVYIYSNNPSANETEPVIIYDFMINEGTTALPFQPYIQKYNVVEKTRNLLNEDKLIDVGAVKTEKNEYYFKYASTPYKKIIWENTDGYEGQITVSYDVSFINDTGSSHLGCYPMFRYEDGTALGAIGSGIYNNMGYQHTTKTSTAGKKILYIDMGYATGSTQTYLKNVQFEYGTKETSYQPYIQRYKPYIVENLIKQPYADGTSKTINGITFTVDEQTGWVTANGTSTAIADFDLCKHYTLTIPAKSAIKGCPNGGSSSTYQIQIYRQKDAGETYHKNFSSWGETDNEANTWGEFVAQFVRIRIRSGVTVNNLVFKPELIKLP